MDRGQQAEPGPDVAGWLVSEARSVETPGQLLDGLCQRLAARGVPLARASIVLFTLHPLIHGRSFRWRPGHGSATEVHPHGLQHLPAFARSPFKALREGTPLIHRRLSPTPSPPRAAGAAPEGRASPPAPAAR